MANPWDNDEVVSTPLDDALKAEKTTGKTAAVARSIYEQESTSGKNTKTSNAGAVGGMQIIPSTFKEVADPEWDINDPVHNARAGVRYVQKMADRAGGDPALTAAGYYGGPGGQDKARRGIAVSDPRNPKAPTTLEYGQQVAARVPKDEAAAAPAGNPWDNDPIVETKPAAAAKQPAVSTKRTFVEELGRQLGLTVRAGVNGVAAVPAMVSDAVTGPINAGLDATVGKGAGPRFQQAGRSVDDLMTRAGLPVPETSTERVVQDAASAVAGAGGFVGAGRAIAGAGGSLAKAVGEGLSAGPKLQLASAASGGAAAGAVREGGGGAGAQLAAGVAGSLAPGLLPAAGAAAARGALRGGEAGRQRVADNLATFEAAGVEPTLGQAAGGKMQRVEALLAKAPGGSGVIARYADKQADDLSTSVQRLSDELAPGASAANAGEAISRGLQAFRSGFKSVQQKLYANLDRHIPGGTPIQVENTKTALAALNEEIPGAPAISQFFRNSKLSAIDRALVTDLDAATKAQAPVGMSSTGMTPRPGGLPYEALKKLRTLVGNEIADSNLVSDVPRSKWNALYGALSEDLGVAAKKAGPEAEKAWGWANNFTKTQIQRLDELSTIAAKDSPEKIFNAAIAGSSEGDTIVKRVISALPKRERSEVAAAVLQRLGRATAGRQNSSGDAFSSETFLSNLSKLSPIARQTIFGRTDRAGIAEQVAKFAKVAELRREGGKVFANPSGTAGTGAQLVNAAAIGASIPAAVVSGGVVPLLGAVLPMAAANLGARALTSPGAVRFAAGQTELRKGATAAVVGATTRLNSEAPSATPWDDDPIVDQGGAPAQTGPGGADPAAYQLDGLAADPVPPQSAEMPPPMPGQSDPGALDAAPPDTRAEFSHSARPDGTLQLQGDPAELRAMLSAAGVPARSIAAMKGGVLIGRSQTARVQDAIAAMQQQSEQAPLASTAEPAPPPAARIDVAAHDAATSPNNDRPEPTEAQQRAGNYRLGHDRIAGMDISIENPEGSVRRGVDPDGTAWETPMRAHYGYLKGSTAADGDKLDVFVKPGTPGDFAGPVFVIDQLDPRTGQLDEHKSVIGAANEKEAEQIYRSNYAAGWTGFGSITRLPLTVFKAWAKAGDKRSPLGDLSAPQPQDPNVQDPTLQADGQPDPGAQTQLAQAAAPGAIDAAGPAPAEAGGGDATLAAAGVAPAVNPIAARIQRLHDAGEKEVAELMKKQVERQERTASAPQELEAMRSVSPDLGHHTVPEFAQTYAQLRAEGVKPAEAAGRAGVLAFVQAQGPAVGLSARMMAALQPQLESMPLEKVPLFVQRFTASLIEKGALQPFDGADRIGAMLERARDGAMHAMAEASYKV